MARKYYDINEIVFAEKLTGPKFQDLEGKQFGRLIVLGFAGIIKKHRYWYCLCSCGNTTKVAGTNLVRNFTNSCGCFSSECLGARATRHGKTNTEEYSIYTGIKTRCENKNEKAYAWYGARGIKLLLTFEEFLDEIGKRPSKNHSVDRINNDGNYERGNIRWATSSEQANNTRKNVLVCIGNETKTLSQWASTNNLSSSIIGARKSLGWCRIHAVALSKGSKMPQDCPDCIKISKNKVATVAEIKVVVR